MPRQNTSPANYPQAVVQQIEQLAHNIVVARKRRGETQAQWAKRLGVSQPTFARIERGDPGVAMASYVMCMWLIDPAVGLADLISPLNDRAALEREVTKVSKKRRASGAIALSTPATPKAHAAQARGALMVQEPQPIGDAGAHDVGPVLPVDRAGASEPLKGKGNAIAEGLAALMRMPQEKPR